MNNQLNWNQIKQALKENFIEQDFKRYATTTFVGIDFDKGLEVFRYILEQKLPNHDETSSVLDKLQLYAKGNQDKDILENIAYKYEIYIKKLFDIMLNPFPAGEALGFGHNHLFDKLSIASSNRTNPTIRNQFFDTDLSNGVKKAKFSSTHFNNLFTDNTNFGKSLHSSYHNRNLKIHNDSPLSTRQISDYTTDFLNSYLYFTFKYYNELVAIIRPADLIPPQSLTLRNLASLSGGAYNPDITNQVKRDNIIQTIKKKLESFDVLFIEGEEGIGKTTILHQFVSEHPNNCFAYFIDGKDSNTYSNLAILQALCNQLCFVGKECELEEDTTVNNYTNEDWLKNYLSNSFRYITTNKKSNQIFYFIIDGLDEISQDKQNEIREQIISKLPCDKPNIKLVLSGKQNKDFVKRDCKYDKFEMIVLSKEDSYKIFGNSVTLEQFNDINNICNNNAGKIVFFRDLIKNNCINVNNIVDKLSSDLKGVYQYLWDISNINENCKIILAIIVFQDEKYDNKSIAKILKIDEREVIDSLQTIPFLKKNIRGKYEFIFKGFAEFSKIRLSNYQTKIDKIIIDYLLKDLDSVDSLIRLPEMFKKTGKKDELMKLLTNERWKQLLVSSEKISVVSRVSNITLETIQDENENIYIPTILKYSVLKSALKELSQITVWQYEIAASLVLGDYIVAENLANIAFLKEDKLKMFASIARAYTERKEKVPNNIQKKVEELYDEIDSSKDFKNIKESAVEIASLLMYSNPKLAFRLIEDLSGAISDNDNAFDWALTQMSLSVHSNLENLEDVSKEDINTKVYSKIRNPKIKEFADAILYLSENQTSEQIIEKINQLESTSQKMFLIRNWIVNNQKDENVAEIIDLGLKLVVDKSDKYIPKSSDYKIFVMPLPYIQNKDKAYELIEKIEQYTISIESNSVTNDLLAIKLLITRTLCNFDFEKGEERLLNIYLEIEEIPDLAIRCACLAIYANEATRIANTHQNQDLSSYLEEARQSITNNIDTIIEQTASHFEIMRSIITNLARLYPKDAINISQKLNKSIDRDNAFLESLATYLKQPLEKIDTKIVDILLNGIVDLDIQRIAISEIINKLEGVKDNEKDSISKFYLYFDKVDNLFDNRAKCILYVKIISILEQNEEVFFTVCDKLNQTWNELEKSVYKIELGFEIAYNAAFLKNTDLAKNILCAAKEEKDNAKLLLDSPNTTEVFNLVIELAIRVFSGLVFRNNYEQKDIDDIAKIIDSLPSERQQMNLWASLILRIIPKTKDEKFIKQLINSYIISKLSKIKNKNERISAILDVIVVLYFNDKNMPNLEELPNQKLKDIALSKVCKYLFTTCLPNDICDDNSEGYTINHETVEKILDLTNLMKNDNFIVSQIIDIRKSIFSKNTKISGQKKIDIKNRFEGIASSKLPDLNNIKHSGYQLLVKANAIVIQLKQKWDDWNSILQEVEKIPNLADRIFMWDSIAELLPNEFMKQKQELINKAIDSAYKLPSFLDTVERIQMIFFTLNKGRIDGVGLKPLLENFIKVINKNPYSPFLRENYKKILDVAHSTDPTMAKAMINSFDNDTARLNTGAYLDNHYNLLEFQSKLERKLSSNDTEKSLLENNPKFFNKIIEKKLARLNASKIVNDDFYPKDLVYQLKVASQYSIYESRNTFSYFIERLVMTYENKDEAKKIIRKSFLELLEVCNLVKLLSIRNAHKIKSLLDVISDNTQEAEINLEDIKSELGKETYNSIILLLQKGKEPKDIANLFDIGIEKVYLISEALK